MMLEPASACHQMGGSRRHVEAEDKSRRWPWVKPLKSKDPDEHHEPLWSSTAQTRGSAFRRRTFPPATPVSYLNISISHGPAKWFYKWIVLDHGRLVYVQSQRKIFRLVLKKNLTVSGCFGLPS